MNFIANESRQKLRGGYYTPLSLAAYITRWIDELRPASILEPSCGDGVFVEALRGSGFRRKVALTAFETQEEEAVKAKAKCSKLTHLSAQIHVRDFLEWAINEIAIGRSTFDAVVGNPPFVRYQYLNEISQRNAET